VRHRLIGTGTKALYPGGRGQSPRRWTPPNTLFPSPGQPISLTGWLPVRLFFDDRFERRPLRFHANVAVVLEHLFRDVPCNVLMTATSLKSTSILFPSSLFTNTAEFGRRTS
jgi:hypothetical protein